MRILIDFGKQDGIYFLTQKCDLFLCKEEQNAKKEKQNSTVQQWGENSFIEKKNKYNITLNHDHDKLYILYREGYDPHNTIQRRV